MSIIVLYFKLLLINYFNVNVIIILSHNFYIFKAYICNHKMDAKLFNF